MRKRLVAVTMAAAIALTGCTSVPDLEHVYRDMEAEYMAGLLLKYDANNEDMLHYDRSVLRPTPKPTPVATVPPKSSTGSDSIDPQGGKGSGKEPEQQSITADIGEVLSVPDITVSQGKYELKKSYGSDFAAIDASDGHQLLIARFRVRNNSGGTKRANLMGKNLQYSLSVDGATSGTPLMTILDNDLQFFDMKLGAGDSREAVLIFEVSKSVKLKNAVIRVTDGTKTAQLPLK